LHGELGPLHAKGSEQQGIPGSPQGISSPSGTYSPTHACPMASEVQSAEHRNNKAIGTKE